MKRAYVSPILEMESFVPNQRVAACKTQVNSYTKTDITWKCSRADGSSDDEGSHNDLLAKLNAADIFYSTAAGCTTCVTSMEDIDDILTGEGYTKWGFSYSTLTKGSIKQEGKYFCKASNGEHTLFVNEFDIYEEIINS